MTTKCIEEESLSLGSFSIKGKGKFQNDDSIIILTNRARIVQQANRGLLFGVADGMTTSSRGGTASRLVTEELFDYFKTAPPPRVSPQDYLKQIIEKANRKLIESGYGKTTLSAGLVIGNNLHIYHAGDSSVIVYDSKNAFITPKQRERPNDQSSDLINCMGDPRFNLYYRQVDFSYGHALFLTDGVTRYATDQLILEAVDKNPYPRAIVRELSELVTGKGCVDDATLIVLEKC